MKTENTPENKARFFALYWGQSVCKYGFVDWDTLNTMCIKDELFYSINKNKDDASFEYHLQLKPLTEITDEDLLMVDFEFPMGRDGVDIVFTDGVFWTATKNGHLKKDGHLLPHHVDYLRSKGYNCGFHELTPEDVVEYGWVKYAKER